MGAYVNSQLVQFDRSHVSCGVLEAHHLPKGTAAKTAFAIANNLYHKANPRPAAFVIFSDVVGEQAPSRGQSLAEYFKTKLTKEVDVLESRREVNPRTGNVIILWVLQINHEAFREWYKEELANRLDGEGSFTNSKERKSWTMIFCLMLQVRRDWSGCMFALVWRGFKDSCMVIPAFSRIL